MSKEKQRGIYIATDHTTAKSYLGATVDKHVRFSAHDSTLSRDEHHNKHLQKAFNDHHDIRVLFIPVHDDVNPFELEKQLIDEFRPTGILYNVHRVAAPPMLGRKHTAEAKEKMKAAHVDRILTPEAIEARAASHRGLKRSEQTRANMSLAKAGKEQSEQGKAASRANAALVSRSVTVNGTSYESITAAARVTGLPEYRIRYQLNKNLNGGEEVNIPLP